MLSVLNRGKIFYTDLIKLAIPIMLQNLITNSLGLMDTFMVGLLPGETPIAGVALANIPIFVILLIIFGMQSGNNICQKIEIRKIINNTIYLIDKEELMDGNDFKFSLSGDTLRGNYNFMDNAGSADMEIILLVKK
jgi:hypothetical protein